MFSKTVIDIDCRVDWMFTVMSMARPHDYEARMVALYHEGFTVSQLEEMFPGFRIGVIAEMIEENA